MKGKRIKTFEQLAKAADERKSIVWGSTNYKGWKPTPAMWALNWSGGFIRNVLHCGMWIYKKAKQ
jgi:hypothetical protein